MLPQIEAAKNLNIPVLVMNPSQIQDPLDSAVTGVSKSAKEHSTFVWDRYVKDSGFTKIDIICFSAGGSCVQAIQTQFSDTFYNQVSKIAFGDCWCTNKNSLTAEQQRFMYENAFHYRASTLPIMTLVSAKNNQTCKVLSSGHTMHDYTIGTCYKFILANFGYFTYNPLLQQQLQLTEQ